MTLGATTALFVATAIAEILGCYLPLLWLTHPAPLAVFLPAAGSLALFVWLLTLHPLRCRESLGRHSHCVVVAHRWCLSDRLGPCWVSDRSSRHGRHHVGAKSVASKSSHPAVAGVALPNRRVRRPSTRHSPFRFMMVCHAGG